MAPEGVHLDYAQLVADELYESCEVSLMAVDEMIFIALAADRDVARQPQQLVSL